MKSRGRSDRTGRNDPCPCGSGRKYKHCCLGRASPATRYTQEERSSALAKLEAFVAEDVGPEDDAAWDSFFERWCDGLEGLDEEQSEASEAAYDMWFYLDYALEDGRRPVDLFLDAEPALTAGERGFLDLLREATVRLYDMVDAVPGVSLTLRDVVTGATTVVRERLGSRSIPRHTLLAARVIASGASGEPEMERGVLAIPELARRAVLSQHEAHHERWRRENPGSSEAVFDRLTPPFVHDAWIACILEPPLPHLQNTDGEDLLLTRVRFEVADPPTLELALDAHAALAREEGRTTWYWSGRNPRGEEVSLGRIVLDGSSLTLECNSAGRGERGRALIENLGEGGISHRATTHENPAAALRDSLRRGEAAVAGRPDDLPRAAQEALTLDHLPRHYRGWLDEKVPALDDHTPREAARDVALRPRLVELIEGLEGQYQRALQRGEPAYDPSWMWDELALEARPRPAHPPPLAHERIAGAVPGLTELCAAVAASVRQRPGFDDVSNVVTAGDLASNLQVQQFLRSRAAGEVAGGLAAHVQSIVNHELHRRKTFWVDEALAYMLAKTDAAVPGRDLRVPFASFALAFTDRHSLSLGERLLSLGRSSLAGHFLKVATVYVTEERRAEGRVLRIALALDALGADLPHLEVHEVPLAEDVPVQRCLEGVAPFVATEPPVADCHPLRGLLQVTLNAILYATSAGVQPQPRQSPGVAKRKGTAPGASAPVFSSETVFFLPGAIEISLVRQMQELERVPSGRGLLHRFMVRGHWRRAPDGWKDQRMRWIEPYWKGPDLAAIVERAYKLTP